MKKQTAVEFIEEVLQGYGLSFQGMIDEAKEMENQTKEIHKQEIIRAAARGYLAMPERFNLEEAKDYGEQYYDNICGGKENE
jgi:hypothetical protein